MMNIIRRGNYRVLTTRTGKYIKTIGQRYWTLVEVLESVKSDSSIFPNIESLNDGVESFICLEYESPYGLVFKTIVPGIRIPSITMKKIIYNILEAESHII